MSSTVWMERTGAAGPMAGFPSSWTPGATAGAGMAPMNYVVVPKCTFKVEKTADGCKINCICEDKQSCSVVQNLCSMLAGGMCSVGIMMNGMPICNMNFAMCCCTCENTKDGVCITCMSGDKNCCKMIQSCCECMMSCLEAGCTCCVCFNNTPVCCGGCKTK